MKRVVVALTLALTPFLAGAMARLQMFNGLIGQGVKAHCERSDEEKADDMRVVNQHTGPYRVVIVCESEPLMDEVQEEASSRDSL